MQAWERTYGSDSCRAAEVFLCFASAGMVLFGYTVEGFHTFVYSVLLGRNKTRTSGEEICLHKELYREFKTLVR